MIQGFKCISFGVEICTGFRQVIFSLNFLVFNMYLVRFELGVFCHGPKVLTITGTAILWIDVRGQGLYLNISTIQTLRKNSHCEGQESTCIYAIVPKLEARNVLKQLSSDRISQTSFSFLFFVGDWLSYFILFFVLFCFFFLFVVAK